MFGGSITNDKGFPIVNLLDISESFIGLTYKPEDVSNKGTIVLRSSNIQNGQLDFNDTVRVDKQIREKLIVKQNDILMCSRNGSSRLVGKVALINRLKEEMTFGAFMSIIRSEHYRYLLTYFELDAFRRQIVTGATTTVNQITQNMLSKIYLPLPPIDLQNKYEKFAVQIDKSKFIVQQQIEQLNNLLNSKMNEYFG